MITARDFVELPLTRELTEAGLLIARRALVRLPPMRGNSRYDAVRRSAAAASLGLGFRHYLTSGGVSFDVKMPPPFLEPDRYDVRLGSRSCDLKTFLISRASEWRSIQDDPEAVLDAPALVPLDLHVADASRPTDVYVFGIVGAAAEAGDRPGSEPDTPPDRFWMHCLPPTWYQGQSGAPLGPATLKAETAEELAFEFGGLNIARQPTETVVRLVGGDRLAIPNSFVALSHLGIRRRPAGRVGIQLHAHRLQHIIRPEDWENVWLEGWGMMLLGWITRQDFRTRSKLIPAGSRVLQFDRTRIKNLAVPISHLRPIAELTGAA